MAGVALVLSMLKPDEELRVIGGPYMAGMTIKL